MPNPANLQVRYGFEATKGLGNPATFQDCRVLSETLGAELPTIPDDSIIPDAEHGEGLPTKIAVGGDLNVNWMPEDHAKFIAAFFGKSATPTQSPTGVWLHKMAVTETDVSFSELAIEVERDLLRPELMVSGLPSQLTFNAGPRSLLNGAITMQHPRFHMFEDSVQTLGSSTDPFIRGYSTYANLALTDGDIYVEVSAVPGGADFDIKAKIGAGSTYDGAVIPITVGNDSNGDPIWTTLTDENDDQIGSVDLPVQVHWANLTSVIATDEWRFDRERAVWTPTLPASSALNEIAINIQVDGVNFRIRDIAMTLTRPVVPDEVIGGRFIEEVVEFGQRIYTGQLNRLALDTTMIDRLLRAKSFDLQMDCDSTFIAATGVRRRLSLIAKNCIPSGRTPSVGGAAQFDEPIDFEMHPSTDGTYPAAITCEIKNSQASLA